MIIEGGEQISFSLGSNAKEGGCIGFAMPRVANSPVKDCMLKLHKGLEREKWTKFQYYCSCGFVHQIIPRFVQESELMDRSEWMPYSRLLWMDENWEVARARLDLSNNESSGK